MRTIRPEDQELFVELQRLRAEALDHFIKARELSRQRAEAIEDLIALGYSQSDIARQLEVSRQSIQKMLAAR